MLQFIKCGERFEIYTKISKIWIFWLYRATESQMCDMEHEDAVYYNGTKEISNKVWRETSSSGLYFSLDGKL